MGVFRAFVSIKTDPETGRTLGGVIEELSSSKADVKWVHQINLHMTLKFLGDIPEESVPNVIKTLEKCVEGARRPKVRIVGVDVIPNIHYPRVVCAILGGEVERVSELANSVDEEMEALGFKKEDREFLPHVTLGRVKSHRAKSSLLNALRKFLKMDLPEMAVDAIYLVKSELKPTGAIYTDLAEIRFPYGG